MKPFDWRPPTRLFAVVAMVALVILSTVPGEMRPHVAASGNFEHFIAYAGTAFLVEMGLVSLKGWKTPALLSLASAVFEMLQIWIPNRRAGIDNWATSSAGALVGTMIAIAVLRMLSKTGASSKNERLRQARNSTVVVDAEASSLPAPNPSDFIETINSGRHTE